MRRAAFLANVLVTILSSAMPALAAPVSAAQTALDAKLFGAPSDGGTRRVCFSRRYDAAHLASHPRQNVRQMMVLVTQKPDADAGLPYSLTLGVRQRKGQRVFEAGGFCGTVKDAATGVSPLHCGIDCDAGSLDVTLRDGKTLLVSIPDGVRVTGPDDDEATQGLRVFRADDKVFRLDRARLTECLPIVDDDDARKAIQKGR